MRKVLLLAAVALLPGCHKSPSEFPAFTQWSGEIKLYTGTLVDAFINYRVNKHLQLKLSGVNLLNDTYVAGEQTAQIADPSQPIGCVFEIDYKF